LREPSGKPPGGQTGHEGTTLKRIAEPTETVEHPLPRQCMRCHSALPLEQAEVAERRQIIDVPSTVFCCCQVCCLN
jgi:transposase